MGSHMIDHQKAIFCVILLILSQSTHASPSSIDWLPWQNESFNKARASNKLILLDVGTEWCSACNQMHHETYTDPKVKQLIQQNFIAIHVDAEAEPDLGERYGFWGWPALIFIKPDGEHVGFFRGSRPAEVFSQMLVNFQQAYINGELKAPQIEVDLVSPPSEGELGKLVKLGDQMLDRFYDPTNHGWGGSRMANPYLLQQAWWRGQDKLSQHWSSKALETSRRYLNMIDPVWGGIWFGSRAANFDSDFIYEKRTEHQAGALLIFAQAYQYDQDPVWLKAINQIVGYLDQFMLSPNGGYYTSQEMHIFADGVDLTPEAYFALDDQQRRKIGLPDSDKTVYTDINAKLVLAFSKVYEATAEQVWRNRALTLINLIQQYDNSDGGYRHIMSHQANHRRIRVLTEAPSLQYFLRTQAFTGLAHLASYELSGDISFVKQAHRIGETIIKHLRDNKSGGLLGSNRKTTAPDGRPLRDQPLVDTGAAAEFFNRLSAISYGAFDNLGQHSSKDYSKFSEDAVRAVGAAERLKVQGYFIGQYVLALHQLKDEFIQVSVVCKEAISKECTDLHTTALNQLHHPRRIVKLQSPGYYPATADAALFICNSTLCSSPIAATDKELIQKVANWYKTLTDS